MWGGRLDRARVPRGHPTRGALALLCRLSLPLCAAWLLVAPRAAAEACTVTDDATPHGTFSCPSNADGAACFFSGLLVTGCIPTNDDSYVFTGSGYTVVATGNVYGRGPLQRFQVNGALSLLCSAANGCFDFTAGHSDDAPRTMPVMDSGLVVNGGGTVTLNGSYLNPATGAFQSTRPSDYMHVGDIEPCGDGSQCDVAANRSIMRIEWPEDRYDDVEDLLERVDPGDLLCFRDPVTTDQQTFAQAAACYVVTHISLSDPIALEFDVRQGAIDRSGFPLARRNLAKCTVIDSQLCEDQHTACDEDADCLGADRVRGGSGANADLGVGRCLGAPLGHGDRVTLDLDAEPSCAALFGADNRGEAQHWIRTRLGAAPGSPGKQRRIIDSHFVDGASQWQEIEVYPPVSPRPGLGEVLFADHGIRAGDPFWIVRPVRFSDSRLAALAAPITTANAAIQQDQAAGIVVQNGTLNLIAAHLDRYFSATVTSASGRFGTLQDLMLSDATCRQQSGNCAALGTVTAVGSGATFTVDTASISGGPSQLCSAPPTEDCGKGFHSNSGSGGTLTLKEIAARHLGDDCVASHDTTLVANLTHVDCQGMADHAGSAQCIEFDGVVTAAPPHPRGPPHESSRRELGYQTA